MKVLLTGAAGQLGQALRQHVPAGIELIATSRGGDPATGLLPLDLADADACRAAVLSHRPDWVLNGGAYTAVDRAESEPELALALNGERLLQVSTDFVFNGQQGSPLPPRPGTRSPRRLRPHQGRRGRSGGAAAGRQQPGPRRGGRPGGLPDQHRHPGGGLLAGDHRQRAGAGAALV
jgi:hypothetical protein